MQKLLRKCATSISKCHEIVDKWYSTDLIKRVLHEAFYNDYGKLYYYVTNNYKKFHGGYTSRNIRSMRKKTKEYLIKQKMDKNREQMDKSIERLRGEESIKYVWGEYYEKAKNYL